MKALAVLALALALSTPAFAEDTAGPADKADGGSLSSGAKEASPATENTGENEPVGSAATGASSGDSQKIVPGTKKGMGGSDPAGVEAK